MKILIIDNGSRYLDKLKLLTAKYDTFTKKYSEIAKSDLTIFNLVILSGGHHYSVVGHESEFTQEIALIKNAKVPILGICLGFELIAYSYGARMEKMVAKEKGLLELLQTLPDPIFANLPDIVVFESHRWVVSSPGASLIPLAISKDGVEIIKHKTKPIYGFQFHPEMFPDQTAGDELFANFIKIVENI